MGAWLNYGLGVEGEDLPGFVAMTSISKGTTCGQIFTTFTGAAVFYPPVSKERSSVAWATRFYT